MKLEVGKHYRTAKDRKARVYATDGSSDACVHGAVLYENGWVVKSWFANGRRNPVMATFDDLVGKWKEPDPLTYRHYSHEELKTFIGKVVICKATGLPELIVGMVNECTVRLSVKEATSFDLLVMYEWEGKLPCGVLVTTGSCVGAAVGDVAVDYDWGIMGRPFVKPDVP